MDLTHLASASHQVFENHECTKSAEKGRRCQDHPEPKGGTAAQARLEPLTRLQPGCGSHGRHWLAHASLALLVCLATAGAVAALHNRVLAEEVLQASSPRTQLLWHQHSLSGSGETELNPLPNALRTHVVGIGEHIGALPFTDDGCAQGCAQGGSQVCSISF